MPRVLIPTDEPNFILGLVEGYRSLGWEVVIGAPTLEIRASHYDVIHYHWPEEYSQWNIPNNEQIAQIEDHLHWWGSRATNIFTVHNLYPHSNVGHPAFHELYSCFYRHCHLISHFSHASRRLVVEEFPAARQARHIVHCPPNYAVTLASQRQRGSRRAEMGIDEDAFVVLMVGRIRRWDEVKLIQRAFDLARVPNMRLLMAGKFVLAANAWQRNLLRFRWIWWLKRRRAVIDTRYVPEDEISRFLDSSDVVIVPRLGGLNSAIIFLAMTFGRMIIAPNCGAYAEQLAGTRNLIYESGDAKSFASKLEEAAALDTDDIGRENADIASKWCWRDICVACLDAVADRNPTIKYRVGTAVRL